MAAFKQQLFECFKKIPSVLFFFRYIFFTNQVASYGASKENKHGG